MNLRSKRFILITLIFLSLIYSVIIYTVGTESNNGKTLVNENCSKGKMLFQEYNCISCHQIYGLGGYMGPDITNVISSLGKGPEFVKAFLQNGSTRMPNFNLKENEIEEIIAYLNYVDKTGISPVKKFSINYYGTINQDK